MISPRSLNRGVTSSGNNALVHDGIDGDDVILILDDDGYIQAGSNAPLDARLPVHVGLRGQIIKPGKRMDFPLTDQFVVSERENRKWEFLSQGSWWHSLCDGNVGKLP